MNGVLVQEVTHYCNITSRKCLKLPKEKIDYYDFTFELDGSMVYYVNGQKITLQRNDAIFLKPGTLRARDSGNQTVRYVSFNFYAAAGVTFPFSDYMQECITADIRKMILVYPPSHLSSFYHAKEKCASILNYILYELLDFAVSRCDNEYVSRILGYIDEHIREKMILKTISDFVGLSREYTCSIFKRETGKTLTSYINERKMLLAKELILDNEMNLADIAAYLGFEDYNYFSRLIKRYLNVSPLYLRTTEKCKI